MMVLRLRLGLLRPGGPAAAAAQLARRCATGRIKLDTLAQAIMTKATVMGASA